MIITLFCFTFIGFDRVVIDYFYDYKCFSDLNNCKVNIGNMVGF